MLRIAELRSSICVFKFLDRVELLMRKKKKRKEKEVPDLFKTYIHFLAVELYVRVKCKLDV